MSKDDVVALFEAWNAALATLDPDTVTAMYADDAVLLPTVSNQVRHNHAEIRDYFVNFLQKSPQGVINESNVHTRVRRVRLTQDVNIGLIDYTLG